MVWGFMSMPPNTTVLRSLVFGVQGDLLGHLVRQLAGGQQHRGAHGWRAGDVELFSCLSRRCSRGSEKAAVLPVPVCGAHHVLAGEHHRNGLRLDGRHGLVAHFGYGARQRLSQR